MGGSSILDSKNALTSYNWISNEKNDFFNGKLDN
jgi:hypothetical protein